MSGNTGTTVGFIGLGVMGSSMAANLRKAGYRVIVHDIRREAAVPHEQAGAIWAPTPRAIAEQCDVMCTCLPSLTAIEQVALGPDGLIQGIRAGGVYFEMSTNSLELARRLHDAFAERGAHMLEAPISGGGVGARRGKLAIWVGGDKAAYDRYAPVLRAIGDRTVHVGPIGSGIVTKLVHNCASQTMQAAIAEAFVMGVKAGAEPRALWEAIRQGSIGRRRTFDGLAPQFLPAQYDSPEAALRIVYKDLTLATAVGREIGAPMPFANLALSDIQTAMNRGWSERDCRSVMLLPQERARVEIKVDLAEIDAVFARDPAAPTDTRRGTDRA
jgi:3-hydroxyisobutyrate dehydrogenase-like beta-hydroxyacid dehydrogenase